MDRQETIIYEQSVEIQHLISQNMCLEIERDALKVANSDLQDWFDGLKFEYDALLVSSNPVI